MFELLDVKWGEPTFGTPSGTITWSSDLGGDLVLGGGATDASIASTFEAALQAWEAVAAVDFQQVSSGADFTVGAGPIDIRFAGVASYGPDLPGLNSLTAGSITFNSQYVWSDEGGPGTTDFYAVALHEIGHIIGLDHPDDPTQIMNATIFVDELADGDIDGAQFIYGTGSGGTGGEFVSSSDGGGGGGALGLLVGLLALIASLFTGGGGGVVAMAAGRLPQVGEGDDFGVADPELEPDLAAYFGHGDLCSETGVHSHGVSISEFTLIPAVDFTTQPNPCGCVGMCEHIIDPDEPVDGFLV